MKSHVRGDTVTHGGRNLDAQYDILNFWNFPSGLGLKVKVGTYSLNAPQGLQLSLCEQMIQWPTGFTKVRCDFSYCFDLHKNYGIFLGCHDQ